MGDAQKFSGLSAQWTDLNDDVRLALLVAYDGEQNYLYPNNGTFTDLAYQAGVAVNQDGNEQADMGVAMGDYQHIGRFDIAMTHFSEEYAESYCNDGSMNSTDVPYDSGVAPTTEPFVG